MAATVYFDNNATTRVDPRVVEAMLPYFSESYGNPSSLHHFGARVAAEIEQARSQVADLIGARETEVIFTSGGTEANNLALRGLIAARPAKRHIITTTVEHAAILEPLAQLAAEGFEVTHVPVDACGRIDLAALRNAFRDDTLLVSVMLANNETGVVFPLAEVSGIATEHGVFVHTDAVNAVGKIPVNVNELGVHLLSLSGHKLHGPKGCGALYVRRGTPLQALLRGGPQERDRRGGTHNAPGIIGLGHAACLAKEEQAQRAAHTAPLRDLLETRVRAELPSGHLIASEVERLPNTSCICFAGVEAEAVLMLLSQAGICASSGSACSSGSLEPSHVLQAMGIAPEIAQGQIRLSLSHESTTGEVEQLLTALPPILARVAAVNI